MLNLLLLTCVNARKPQRAMDLMHQAHALEQKSRDEAGSLSEEQRIVDVVSYNTVLKGFAQDGDFQSCFECLRQMQKHGLQPDDVTCVTMLDMCMLEDDSAATDKILEICGRNEWPFDTVTCSVFIKGLLRADKLPKAMELYEKMKSQTGNCARPDIVTYSLLIKAFVEKHDLDSALRLVEDMAAVGLHPDDIILTHLLEGCRHAGNQRLGKNLFNDMVATGVKPSKFTMMAMLKLHGRCGAYNEAYRLLADCEKEYGLMPTVLHYTCLMSACLRTKSYDQAFAAFELMLKNGVKPDKTTIEKLLPGMVKGHKYDCVVTLAQHALQASPRIPIDVELLNRALSQMEHADGQEAHMLTLWTLMQKSGTAKVSGTSAAKFQQCR
jgi:pentatricopeptide repeat protein